jgi:hypothetical protein
MVFPTEHCLLRRIAKHYLGGEARINAAVLRVCMLKMLERMVDGRNMPVDAFGTKAAGHSLARTLRHSTGGPAVVKRRQR